MNCTPRLVDLSVSIRTSSKAFGQDGHQCSPVVRKMHSVCDSHLFSSVVAGKACDKANTQHIATSSGFTTDDAEHGDIDSPMCSDSVEKYADESYKVVDGAENMDQKCGFLT